MYILKSSDSDIFYHLIFEKKNKKHKNGLQFHSNRKKVAEILGRK